MEENRNDGYFKGLFTGILMGTIVMMLVFTIVRYDQKKVVIEDPLYSAENTETEDSVLFQKMKMILSGIDSLYLNEYDEEVMEDAVCSAMLEALDDPYTCYYTKEEYAKITETVTGKYCGIGVGAVQNGKTGEIFITTTFKTGTAYEVGIESGDQIIAVEGENIEGMSIDEVVSLIKGEEGTDVNISILRDGEKLDFTMKRKMVEIDTVYYRMLEDNIGYIQLTDFDEISMKQFSEAVEDLQSQGMEKIIVDIRNNPGGRMDVVCDISNTFLEKDKLILYTEDKYGNREEVKTTKDGVLIGMPLIVLVNGNSASASEVFSGVVKDYNIGKVIGTQTFGKGIVQRLIQLNDGSAMKVTYSKYYTPNGINIHGTGIEPNEVVELPNNEASPLYVTEENDTQLQKAIELFKE